MRVISGPLYRRGSLFSSDQIGLTTNRQAQKLIVFLSLGLSLLSFASLPATAQEHNESAAKPINASLSSLQEAFVAIAEELEPATVTISATTTLHTPADGAENTRIPFVGPRRSVGTGTGVIVRSDGWILTNDHVVEDADRVVVRFHDGREYIGTVFRDPRSDLAVVKVETKTSLPVARLGDSDKIKIGQWAVAIGSPYRYEGSFSVGVVSSLFRRQEIYGTTASGSRGHLYPNMIQTDAAINPGNSGGPLCNIAGEVIGINTAIESERGGGSVGIGFAIPINTAKYVMNQLIEKGKVTYGYLGVNPTSVTPRNARALKVDQGALINIEPHPDSPAGKAGLKVGDVVVAINGKPVRNEIDLRTIVSETPPDTRVALNIVRNGERQVLTAVLGKVDQEDPVTKPRPVGKANLGLEVQSLTDKLADRAGVPRDTKGVYVKSIDPDSSVADDEELTERCVIIRVNDKETPTLESFQTAIANLKPGDQVGITFLKTARDGFVKRYSVITVD